MGAVTYPDQKVADFVMSRMVPLQVLADSPLAEEFKVKWTPTIIVLDYYGKEHHRTVGFFPPEEFIPSLLLGMGKIDFDTDQFNDAIIHFDRLLADYPTERRRAGSDLSPGRQPLQSLPRSEAPQGGLREAQDRLPGKRMDAACPTVQPLVASIAGK